MQKKLLPNSYNILHRTSVRVYMGFLTLLNFFIFVIFLHSNSYSGILRIVRLNTQKYNTSRKTYPQFSSQYQVFLFKWNSKWWQPLHYQNDRSPCKGSSTKYEQFIRVTMVKNWWKCRNQKCKKSHINPYTNLMKNIIGIW